MPNSNDESKVTVGGIGNVVSVNQSGGQTAHTIVNQGPRYAVITPETIAQIKQGIPLGSTVSVTRSIQDGPTAQVASQFFEIVKKLGYTLDPPLVNDALGYPYFKGIQLHDNGNGKFTLMIGDPRVD